MKKKIPLKTVRNIEIGIAVAALVCFFADQNAGRLLKPVGMILCIVGGVFEYLFYRCPHCKSYLINRRDGHCSRCGKRIEE